MRRTCARFVRDFRWHVGRHVVPAKVCMKRLLGVAVLIAVAGCYVETTPRPATVVATDRYGSGGQVYVAGDTGTLAAEQPPAAAPDGDPAASAPGNHPPIACTGIDDIV